MPKEKPKRQITLKDYFLIIFLRKRLFLLPFLIIFFTASIGSFFLPKYYRSSALIKMEEQKPINPLIRNEQITSIRKEPTLSERMKTLTQEILSYERLYLLVRELKLYEGSAQDLTSFEGLIKDVRGRISVKMKSPEIFAVSYEDTDPRRAKKGVNTLMTIFIEENREQKKKEARIGVEFARAEAKIYKERLEEAEAKLEEYRKSYALELPGTELDMNVQMLVNFQTELAGVKMDILNIQEKIDKINRQIAGTEPVIISQDMMELNPIVLDLNKQLQQLQSQLETLLIEDPNSEDVYELQRAIDDARDRLQEEIEKHVDAETLSDNPLFYQRLVQKLNDAKEQMKFLKDRETELKMQVDTYEGRMKSLPEQEAQYSRLSRDVELNEQIYKMLKLKEEESRLTAVELERRGINYEWLERGRLPLKPAKPQKLLISIVALLLGVIGGFGCVFIAEFADRSFKNTQDAMEYLDITYLGSVNKIMTESEITKKRRNKRLVGWFVILALIGLIVAGTISTITENLKAQREIAKQEQLLDEQ
jgi:polysaccharide chain length determinant protein (PEP-CTERM system associated)